MTDAGCIEFLQWALPRIELCWPGFRKVRGLVCKRLGRRLRELGLSDLSGYRAYLDAHPDEWRALDALCRIPISRFYRDRAVFEAIEYDILPALIAAAIAEERFGLACWSACCASGEEAYTLAILWHARLKHRFPQFELRIVATDIDARMLQRARKGCYRASSLRALPAALVAEAFTPDDGRMCVREEFRRITLLQQDIRRSVPEGEFDLILCRNAVLTYFSPALRREIMQRLVSMLRPGGALVIGIHEKLPEALPGLAPWPGERTIYRRP